MLALFIDMRRDNGSVPFIFFGIPKTGTTSMQAILEAKYGPVYSRGIHSHTLNSTCRDSSGAVVCPRVWAAHHVEAPAPDTHFKFTFVRNPWDRMTSLFEYLAASSRRDVNKVEFELFVADVENILNRGQCKDIHLKPQYDWVHDDEGNLQVDFVGRFEQLHEDWEHVCNKLKLNPDHSRLDHLKASTRRHSGWRDYYTSQELIDAVGELYERDITTWNYTFDG